MPARFSYRVVVLAAAFALTNCSLSPFGDSQPEGRTGGVTASVCETSGGVWIGALGSTGNECNCYDTACCDAIGENGNVECILE